MRIGKHRTRRSSYRTALIAATDELKNADLERRVRKFWSARRLERKRFLALTGSLTKGVE
jgi:hypothetical protein